MKEQSAGILAYRIKDGNVEVLLGKPGGPKWENKAVGAWNIPKGHIELGEEGFETALREFGEETSLSLGDVSSDQAKFLGSSTTSFGKVVYVWAIEKDFNPDAYKVEIKSNLCETEWPKDSGNIIEVPELSEAYYFKLNVAKRMIFPYQKIFLDKLEEQLQGPVAE